MKGSKAQISKVSYELLGPFKGSFKDSSKEGSPRRGPLKAPLKGVYLKLCWGLLDAIWATKDSGPLVPFKGVLVFLRKGVEVLSG